MSTPPDNVALATAFVAAPSERVFKLLAGLARWPEVFPGWIVSIADEDDRFTATGTGGEMFDLYAHADLDARMIDVEVVDELGAADVLRIRLLDTAGGCFIAAACARVRGVSDADWNRKRGSIADALAAIGAHPPD